MARMKFRCPGLNHSIYSSELTEKSRQVIVLPVPDGLPSSIELFDCNANVERSGKNTWAQEVLLKYMQVVDIENNPTMDLDISYPTWIGEKLILLLLPKPLACYGSGFGDDPIRPVETCTWFENDTSTNGSGGECRLAQDIKLNVEELPSETILQSNKSSINLSSPIDKAAEDFTKLKMIDFEAASISDPYPASVEENLQISVDVLEDVGDQTNLEEDEKLVKKTIQIRSSNDSEMWNFSEISDSHDVEPCSASVVKNQKCNNSEDRRDLTCLLESFCSKAPMSEEYAPELQIKKQTLDPQNRPHSFSVRENMMDKVNMNSKAETTGVSFRPREISEKSESIKVAQCEQIPSPKHRSRDISVQNIEPRSVEFVDLTNSDDSFLKNSLPSDAKPENEKTHEEHKVSIEIGASGITSKFTGKETSCTVIDHDNSDHSTISDEKTTCSTGPHLLSFNIDVAKGVKDSSVMNGKHAHMGDTSHKNNSQSLKSASELVLEKKFKRQDKTCHDLETVHRLSGSTSFSPSASESVPSALIEPTHTTPMAPSSQITAEEVSFKKFLGSQETKGVSKNPLLIIVANITKPNGSALLQRRKSYQRILELENEQLQIVERKHLLPVDLILSPSTCLIVYTAATLKNNWRKNSSLAFKENSAFIDAIIINCHMKAMSFSFENCFLIFEGEPAFTSYIHRSTPKLAEAAAGFGMQVQCFVSGDPQYTEDLVLTCIERVWQEAKEPYSFPMSDCMTDGELFLDQFPSINPLTAHAILCLGVPLSKFVLWSCDDMVSALQDYGVPKTSLTLFKMHYDHGRLTEEQGPGSIMHSEETHQGNNRFLSPAFDNYGDFDLDIADGLANSENGNFFFYSPPDRILGLDLLGDDPPSDKHTASSPPLCGPALRLDPKFFEDFTSERCFNFWDEPHPESEVNHSPAEPWREKNGPTQRTIAPGKSDRWKKPKYIQSCLDKWIDNMKREKMNFVDLRSRESERGSTFDPTRASSSPGTSHQNIFPDLKFESNPPNKRENEETIITNKILGKRAASALDLFRHQNRKSLPLPKRLKLPFRPHLRSAEVDIPSIAAAQAAHLSKRISFNPVSNPSRFSRPP